MSNRARIAWFGTAAGLVIVGAVCAVIFGGATGPILALVLISLGLVLATSLVFLEVGLSEDREREDEQRRRLTRRRAPAMRRSRPALERSRGHRRRLR